MDLIKIGKFIADCRKQHNLTQRQLAERLHVTDRAVSKWETGRSLPDSSIMLSLCEALEITVNDLLCGETVAVADYDRQMESNLLEAIRQKESADRRLLAVEIYVGGMAAISLFALIVLAGLIQMEVWMRVALICFAFLQFLIGCAAALRIEQVAGYYECKECGHRYVPSFKTIFLSAHLGRTRYMRCPRCNKKSWQKKTLGK